MCNCPGRVDFWLAVQPNSKLWYDADSSPQTQGVGHLSYGVAEQWHACGRGPAAPQGLTATDVEAEEAKLVWEAGETILVKYRVEMYRGGGENDDETSRTRYTVEDLDPYTTYTSELEAPHPLCARAACRQIPLVSTGWLDCQNRAAVLAAPSIS